MINFVSLTIDLSDEYKECFEKVRARYKTPKVHNWIDLAQAIDDRVIVELDSQGIKIQYHTSAGLVEKNCTYDEVLAVTVIKEGLMLRLSHKRLLFLPATDNRKDTELIMQAHTILENRCKCVFRESNLYIKNASLMSQIKYRLKPKKGYSNVDGFLRGMIIVLICMIFFMATVFVIMPVNNRRIAKTETISLEATYSGCDIYYRHYSIGTIDLEFDDYEDLTMDGCYINDSLVKELENIQEGYKMHILVHPKSETVLQIDVNGSTLLEFDYAMNRLWRESVAFAVMGVLLYAVGTGFLIKTIRRKW